MRMEYGFICSFLLGVKTFFRGKKFSPRSKLISAEKTFIPR